MKKNQKNNSTYGAVFAMMLIVIITVGMAYNAIKKILNDRRDIQEEQTQKSIVVEGLPENEKAVLEGNILYENLTDAEAEKIIDQILESGEKNLEQLEKLETEILENNTNSSTNRI